MMLAAPLTLEEARTILGLCNSYSRLEAMSDLVHRLEWAEWVTLLGEEWSVCDNISQWAETLADETPFAELMDNPALGRLMMTEEERKALAALPDELTIWRGCYAVNKWGLSWSLDGAVAARFPTLHRYRREGETPLLVRATVRRDRIIALKLDREEAEVIAHRPRHVSTSILPPAA